MSTTQKNIFLKTGLYCCILLAAFVSACTQDQPIDSPFDNVERPSFLNSSNDTEQTGIKEDYINTNRHSWQKPEMIINMLGSLEDKVVADLGAGGRGFFSLLLVKKCKKVIALDTDSLALRTLDTTRQRELAEYLQPKLELRITAPESANLNEQEVDVAFISNTYIYLPNRVEYMTELRSKLKEGGKIMIIDFKKKKTPLGPQQEFKVPLFEVEKELETAGFKNIRSNDVVLDYQYIVIASK